MARPERRQEFVAWRGFPPLLPAHKSLGLARQIIKRQLEGLEPPGKSLRIDKAIGRRRGFG
jgi:hypothetical protein